MEINYLKEAFQRLSLLEDDFNLSADAGVVDELKSFVADDIEAPEEEAIIDVEAETEDDLKDSYIGKVILECDCCHARIYKDIADVIIDDETGLANIEERCPVCSTESGFNVIGKIEEFNQDELKDQPEDEDEPEENVEDIEDEEEDDEFTVDESFRSALNKVLTENKHGCTTKGCEDDIELETEEVTEAVNPIMDRVRKKMLAANSLDEDAPSRPNIDDLSVDPKDVSNYLKAYFDDEAKNAENEEEKTEAVRKRAAAVVLLEDPSFKFDTQEDIKKSQEEGNGLILNARTLINLLSMSDGTREDILARWNHYCNAFKKGMAQKILSKGDNNPGIARLRAKMAALPEGCELKEENSIMNNLRKKMLALTADESLTEDLKEVEVKTDAGQVKVKNGFDDKVTVDFSSDAGETDEGEMIVPLDDEDINNIENNEEATEESEEEDEETNESYKLTNEKYNSLNESKVNRYKLTNESYGSLNKSNTKSYKLTEAKKNSYVAIMDADVLDYDCIFVPGLTEEPYNNFEPEFVIESNKDINFIKKYAKDGKIKVGVYIDPNFDPDLDFEEDKYQIDLLKPDVDESFGWPMDLDDADPEDRERYLNSGEPVEIDDPNEDPYFDTLSDIDDFDEETFDELGEAYLRKVYENVDSFITESVASQNGKLTIEGLITFTSGNKKHTSFIFESAQRTKRGKVVLEGMNKTFSNSAKAFSLKGELNNKQFVSESMIYNYNTKILNESNEAETAKVYGRVVVKK
jgi:hypothetical protein